MEKFVGDAVMAVFGVPVAHEDDALRACRAALEMQARLASLNEELERRTDADRVRIGVNTGEVVAGDAASRETFVTGDAVNVAARLEQAAPPGEVLLGEPTYRLVRDAVAVEAVEPLAAKGKSEPVPAYRLLEVAGSGPAPRQARDPLVGREAELGAARAGASSRVVAEQRCRLVTVVGEPGVGQVAAGGGARRAGRRRGRGSCAARCLSYGEGITYWAVAQIVRELAGIRDEHSPAEARARLDEHARGRPERAGVAATDRAAARARRRRRDRGADGGGDRASFLTAGGRGRPLVVARRRHPLGRAGAARPARGPSRLRSPRAGPARSAWPGRSCSSTVLNGR